MKIIIQTLFLIFLCARSCSGNDREEENNESFLMKLVWKCTKTENFGDCLKSQALKFLDKLVQMEEPLIITNYLSLVRNTKASNLQYKDINKLESYSESKSFGTEENMNKNLDEKFWNKLVSLFTTRTIQLSFPSDIFDGRGKEDKILKKGHGVFLMAAMMGGMMMKMALGKIALIAGKALIIGKIALILSLIIALKKFTSRNGGQPEVVYTSSELGTGRTFKRDLDLNEDGADLAYNAYHPDNRKNI